MQRFLEFVSNHYLLVGAFILAFVWMVIEESRFRGMGGARLTPQALTHMLNREQGVVVDIRDGNAFKDGHIVGAINIPQANLEQSMKRLEKYKQKPVIVACANGQKSSQVLNKLRKQGFTKVHILGGGIAAWKNANMPLVKK